MTTGILEEAVMALLKLKNNREGFERCMKP